MRFASFFFNLKMKKNILIILALALSVCLSAQNAGSINIPRSLRAGQTNNQNQNSGKKLNFFVGGNVNTNFGYYLSLTPEAGIYATDWLRVGVGPRYELSYQYSGAEPRHAFGATAFSEFIVARYLILHAGYEFLNYKDQIGIDDFGSPVYDRFNLHELALGIGFQSYISNNVSIYAKYILYPIPNSYYVSNVPIPMFARVGIHVDL